MRVLIVDDSPSMRNFVRGVLKELQNITIDEAESGFEAFRVLAREQYALIITDVNMPDINGLELIRFVKKSARHADAKILVISTQTTDRMKERIDDLGVNGFISKPFEPQTLLDAALKAVNTEGFTAEPNRS